MDQENTIQKEDNIKSNKKEKKNIENIHLTYNLGDKLDELFPQYKPSRKEDKKS